MTSPVLDASALLALINQEPGARQVEDFVTEGAAISAVNLSEVVAKLIQAGMPEGAIHEMLDPLGLDVVAFDDHLAYTAGLLVLATRRAGLSLGDRACLAVARQRGHAAITADQSWSDLQIGVQIQVIR